jgi:hypothetical protein
MAIDANGDDTVSGAELEVYLTQQVPALIAGLRLTVGSAPADLRVINQQLSFPPGQGGLVTLRLELALEAPLKDASQPIMIAYRDTNFSARLGWREIVVRPLDGVVLRDSTAPMQDQSDELRAYPQAMLASPLDVREARFSVTTGAPAPSSEQQPAAAPQPAPARTTDGPPAAVLQPAQGRTSDSFAALIAAQALTAPVIVLALLLAVLLGAGHALTPGHGKTIVAAYLVGARGTARHALVLGLTTTLIHTLGVFLLGFVTLALSNYLLPEQLYPWLELLSGALVASIGMLLFRRRLVGLPGTMDDG